MRKYNIASDLVQVKAIQPVVYKQYDNGDDLEIELFEDGEKINLTNEIVLAFFQLEDETVNQKNCVINDKGNAVATLDNNILSQSGELKVEFTIFKEGKETTTRTLLITVERSINRREAIETIPQWDIVNQVLDLKASDGAAIEEKINTLNQAVEDKYDQLSAAKQVDAEVILARGKEVNLKARLDKTDAGLADIAINVLHPPAPYVAAKNDNSEDCTAIIQALVDKYKKITIPRGTYKILGTITVSAGDVDIELLSGATLLKPADSVNVDPIIRIKGQYSVIHGSNGGGSVIKQLCDSPRGIVSIGDLDATTPLTGACIYNSLYDVMLYGKGSNTSGIPNYGLYMSNTADNESTIFSYYHTINNVQIRYVNVGIGLLGWANANIFNNVIFTVVGNEKYITNYDSAILLKETAGGRAPLDNVISNVFHTGSANAVTLLIDGQAKVNNITNIGSEPGGANGMFIKTVNDTNAYGNIISGTDNVFGGSSVSNLFHSKNVVIYGQSLKQYFGNTTVTRLTTPDSVLDNGYSTHDKLTKIRKYSSRTGLLQNNIYKLFEFDFTGSTVKKFIFDVNVIITRGVAYVRKASGFKFSIDTETKVPEIISYYGIDPVDFFYAPEISGSKVVVYAKIPNNGTGQTVNLKTDVIVDSWELMVLTDLTVPTDSTTYTPSTVSMFLSKSGATSKRYAYRVGQQYFDTTLGKPVWCKQVSPSIWVDATGATV